MLNHRGRVSSALLGNVNVSFIADFIVLLLPAVCESSCFSWSGQPRWIVQFVNFCQSDGQIMTSNNLICMALIAEELELFFKYSLTIGFPLAQNAYSRLLASFLYGCKNSIFILDTSPLMVICVVNIFSHSVASLFVWFILSFFFYE